MTVQRPTLHSGSFFAKYRKMVRGSMPSARAVQQGQRVRELAVVLERKFNGDVAADCVARSALGGRLRAAHGVDEVSRRRIVAQVKHAPDHEVPAVLFVHGEGFVSVGIKRLAGRVAWLS